MKKLYSLALLSAALLNTNTSKAQESESNSITYSVVYNQVNKDCNFPLIGFVNVAKKNQTGLQLGFVNTTVKSHAGAQIGYINTAVDNLDGAQVGFVNTAAQADGAQIGFINISAGDLEGGQIGFFNRAKDTDGAQVGFANVASESQGAQVGFLNSTKNMIGSQFGFLNIVDSIENGIPFGFISIVKNGGYQAFEVSSNEIFPLNITFKFGISKIYTFIQGGYNPDFNKKYAMGAGVGTLLKAGNKFYINPEAYTTSSLGKNAYNGISLSTTLRYDLSKNIQLAAGPSVSLMRNLKSTNCETSFLSFADKMYDDKNWLIFGLKTAVSFGSAIK